MEIEHIHGLFQREDNSTSEREVNATEGGEDEDAGEEQENGEEDSISMLTACGITPEMLMHKAVEQLTTDNAAG